MINPSTREIVQEIEYDEYGNMMKNTNATFQPLTYAGGLYDADTKLVRFGARDYDPTVGRWTTKDPIGFAGGDTNLYGYVGQNPMSFNDPNGLYEVCTRPLENLPVQIGPAYHEYLCVDGQCGGLGPSGSFFGSAGANDSGGGECKKQDDSSKCMDDCIATAVTPGAGRPKYNIANLGGGVNCQRWVDDQINACKRICNK